MIGKKCDWLKYVRSINNVDARQWDENKTDSQVWFIDVCTKDYETRRKEYPEPPFLPI